MLGKFVFHRQAIFRLSVLRDGIVRIILATIAFVVLTFCIAPTACAWNAYNDFSLTAVNTPWQYLWQTGSAFNGSYALPSMVPTTGNDPYPNGWMGENTPYYYMPQCGVWTRYGLLVTGSCKQGYGNTVPGQGFLVFVAPSSGTYHFYGYALPIAGIPETTTGAWIRSERSGMFWNQILGESVHGYYDFTVDLARGQAVFYGQDVIVGSGPYTCCPLYWDANVTQVSQHSVSGLEYWNASADFCQSSGAPHHNWEYLYEPDSTWTGNFNLPSMSPIPQTSPIFTNYGWRQVPGCPMLNNEPQAGTARSGNEVALTGYNSSGQSAVTMLKWTAPRGGYYHIHGSARLDVNNTARLSVVVRDVYHPFMFDTWASSTTPSLFDSTQLLDKGDVILFIEQTVSGSGPYNRVTAYWNAQIDQVATVPQPWTPITTDGRKISCWGRTYDFTSSALPEIITANGANLLSNGIYFAAYTSQWEALAPNSTFTLDEANPEYVKFTTTSTSPSLMAIFKWRLEYDGMLLCDAEIWPGAPGSVNISVLDLLIPFNPDYAKLFYNAPQLIYQDWGQYGTVQMNCGAVPDSGMIIHDFVHGIWVGDEKRGLQWFAESDQALNPATDFVTIQSSKQMILNLLGGRVISSTSPFKYTFGFQASPVKPALPADEPRLALDSAVLNCYNHNYWGGAVPPENSWLKQMADEGVDSLVPWTQDDRSIYMGDPYVSNPDMIPLVNAGTQYGVAVMTNTGCYVEDSEVDTTLWRLAPIYHEMNPVPHYYVCPNSGWQSWFIGRCRKAIDLGGVNGFFLDGSGAPEQCNNADHGDGYMSGNTRKTTAPILASRDLVKQVYLLSRSTGKRSTIVHHSDSDIILPCIAFADAYIDGEHMESYPEYNPTLNRYNNPTYTIEGYRAEMTGLQFGVPAFYLKHPIVGHEMEDKWRSATYAVIHGRMPFAVALQPSDTIPSKDWQIYKNFGGSSADLIGYWESSRPVTADVDFKITTYRRSGMGALCAVGSLRNAPALPPLSGTLMVNRAALGLGTAVIQARNAVTGSNLIKTSDETFALTVNDGQYVWVQVYVP